MWVLQAEGIGSSDASKKSGTQSCQEIRREAILHLFLGSRRIKSTPFSHKISVQDAKADKIVLLKTVAGNYPS